MVVVAETDAELEGDRALLDAADEQVGLLFEHELGEFDRVRVVHDHRAFVAHLLQIFVVLLVAGLRSGQHDRHADGAQGLDEREGFECAADVNRGFLSRQCRLELLHLGVVFPDLVAHDLLGPLHQLRPVGEMLRYVVERFGHILEAEVRHADERNAVFFFHILGEGGHRTGALHHVERRAVRAADVVDAAVAGHGGDHLDAHLLVIFPDDPGFSGEVEFAENVDAVFADPLGRSLADQLHEGVAGGFVAILLGALESFGMHRQNRDSLLFGNFLADRVDVVPDEADDAGRIDERRVGLILVDQLDERFVKLLFAAVDDIHLLEVGRKAEPVQLRSRRNRSPDVPGVGGATDGAVHDVNGVGYRIEHDT